MSAKPLLAGMLIAVAGASWAAQIEVHHIHGVAVDVRDPGIVYVATHTGLVRLRSGDGPEHVGEHRFDLMGFTAHPSELGLMWASGHPDLATYRRDGVGNLGLLASKDGGATWQSVAVRGEADFHALAWSPRDGGHLYGWSVTGEPGLHRISTTSWKVERLPARGLDEVLALAASPAPDGPLLAGTRRGLLASRDRGLTWQSVRAPGAGAPVSAVAFHRSDPRLAYAFVASAGGTLLRSRDAGTTWEPTAFRGDSRSPVIALAVGPDERIVAATTAADVLRSGDGGRTWEPLLVRGRPPSAR